MSQVMIGAAREEKIKGSGGELFIRSWRPAGAVRAVVMIVPGFNAHSDIRSWLQAHLPK
jgi:alpha-beta hydrolase superfamily lysophospholipase